MPSDINKTTHVGTASTTPTFQTLGNNTPFAVFTLKVLESWVDKMGREQFRENLFKIETLGPKAHWVKSNVKAGKRYMIDGYLRYEQLNGKEEVKIRVFHIEPQSNKEFDEGRISGMKETLEKALNIAKSSENIAIVQAKLEVLLENL